MSGGAWEYQMGVYTNATNDKYSGMCDYYQSGYKGIYGNPSGNANCNSSITSNTNGLNYPTNKYYKLYASSGWQSNVNNLGEALGEVRSWYKDDTSFVGASYPWFVRGGYYSIGVNAGGFYFNAYNGYPYSVISFRSVVLTS
jgi:hypothetical protein